MPGGERRKASPGLLLATATALAASALLAGAVRPTRFAEIIPRECLTTLRATGVAGTIYAHSAWGGPVIDAGFPRWRVAFDGRYYRYSAAEWARYHAAAAGEVRLDWLDRRYRPAAYLLRPGRDDGLIALLRGSPATWRELPGCAAFVRR